MLKGTNKTTRCCAACGRAVTTYNMCDRDATDAVWCDDCFDKTACGRGEHGEGCSSSVFEEDRHEGFDRWWIERVSRAWERGDRG